MERKGKKKPTSFFLPPFFPNVCRMDKGFLEAWKLKITGYSVCTKHAQAQDAKGERKSFLATASPLKETWWHCALRRSLKFSLLLFCVCWFTNNTAHNRKERGARTADVGGKGIWEYTKQKTGDREQRSPEPHGEKKYKVSKT